MTVASKHVRPMDALSSPRSASGMLETLVTRMVYSIWNNTWFCVPNTPTHRVCVEPTTLHPTHTVGFRATRRVRIDGLGCWKGYLLAD